MTAVLLEVCVENAEGLETAVQAGAGRVELCSALAVGGLTPSVGLMALAAKQAIPSYAMIRPRAGDFVYSRTELDIMLRDIDAARAAGLPGVVFGASKPDGRLDIAALQRLADHSSGLGITLHRAFDLVPDIGEAIDAAVALGFERILTSGGAKSALLGIETLERALDRARGRISIMPGAGVTIDTIDPLLQRLGVTEVHSSCSSGFPVENAAIVALGFAPDVERKTDARVIRALVDRLQRT